MRGPERIMAGRGALGSLLRPPVAVLFAGVGALLMVSWPAMTVVSATPSVSVALHPNQSARPPGGGSGGGSATYWQSSNWSGYATTAHAPYSSVTANWKVPAVSPTKGGSYSAAWAGIDGFNNNSLIQTGTEQDYYSGAAHYTAWWTTSAQNFAEQVIAHPVAAGDVMSATIDQVSGTNWTMTLSDSTEQWSFTKNVTYSGPGASAEWIMEAPTVGGRIAPMANYASPLTFDPGTTNGVNPALVASDGGELVQGHPARPVSVPSVPDSDTDGFNVSYGSAIPATPY